MKYTVSSPPWESMHFGVYNSNFLLHHLKYTAWSPQTGFPTNIRYDMFYYTIWSTPSHVLLENPCIFLHITVIFNYTIWSTPSQVPGQDSLLILDITYVQLHHLKYTVSSPQTGFRNFDQLYMFNTPYEVHRLVSSLRIHAFSCI